MTRQTRILQLSAAIILLLQSCQKFDLNEDNSTEDQQNTVSTSQIILGLTSTGKGTQTSPLLVNNVLTGNTVSQGSKVWIIGYAVGATKTTLSNAQFSDTTSYSTSLLLADDSTCTDISQCIPIELNTDKLKEAFALPLNQKAFRKCLIIQGTLKSYYKTNGLREISEGHWLYGFDISSISPNPDEWGEKNIN